ncbi:MAG: GDSL-type esterase/lipase family protein [Heyndrickxia sp.]
MKWFKYILILCIILAGAGSVWYYYPQYQINKLQKAAAMSTNTQQHKKTSYIQYFAKRKSSNIHQLAIGDSVIKGIGASENKDFITQFSAELKHATGKTVVSDNEGIPGITSTELNNLIQQGKFDKEIKSANIITINVGGNDILRIAKQKNIYHAIQSFRILQDDFEHNLKQITTHIQKLNPKSTLVYLELYNPLNPNNQYYGLANKLLPKWNINIYKASEQIPSSIVVQTSKVINDKHLQYLSADGVHPNSKGYLAISRKMLYEFKHTAKPAST